MNEEIENLLIEITTDTDLVITDDHIQSVVDLFESYSINDSEAAEKLKRRTAALVRIFGRSNNSPHPVLRPICGIANAALNPKKKR